MSGVFRNRCIFALSAILLSTEVSLGQEVWRTTVPFTYLIDYSQGHVNNPAYLKKIAAAPPTLMHVGEDDPFSSVFGTKDIYGGPQGTRTTLITAQQAQERIDTLQHYVAAMHQAGVKWIIPYINNLAVLGDANKRTGFWEFFDHWNRFREFGFGPRPPEDMVTAQMFPNWPRPKYLSKNDPNYPYKRYEMCVNNPMWRNYLLAVTLNIARTGMDGVFVDEMDLHDYGRYDQEDFRKYIAKKYTPAERLKRFGTSDLSSFHLGYPGDGALWYDTQAFWAYSLGQFLKAVRDEGRKINPNFFVMTNEGPFAHLAGVASRVQGGKDPADWAPYTRLIMFEEMQRPGELGPHHFLDNILQYKIAFGLGFTAGTLLYYAQDPPGIELGMAEAAAGGGGALIQGGYREPGSRMKYRRFFEAHPELFKGYRSLADVALVFDYDQMYWSNFKNLFDTYVLSQYLSDHHIPYDVIPASQIVAPQLRSRYRAVITPDLAYLSQKALAQLHEFAQGGGVWIDIGKSGQYDDAGVVRPLSPESFLDESTGKGSMIRVRRIENVAHVPRFALYLLRESQANDLQEIVKLYKSTRIPEYPYPPPPKHYSDLQGLIKQKTGQSFSVISDPHLEGLRCNVWQKTADGTRVVTLHFVNYYTPIPTQARFVGQNYELGGPPSDYASRILKDVHAQLRLPSGTVKSVTAFSPDSPKAPPVRYTVSNNEMRLTLPPIRTYEIVRIELQ
ncbi:MAG: beta-galactosidase trimerization domain-containing protein [Acidobacteria bacterium]|nr:beta-galactosidase trimerization domain-containing protein [Acidobacteriota bacterium]